MHRFRLHLLLLIMLGFTLSAESVKGQGCALENITIASYNVENVFDTIHDEGKKDVDFLPAGSYHWTSHRYMKKLMTLSKVLVAIDKERPVDIIGLCEVENDTVLHHLLHRTPLNTLGYRYAMTRSPDERGVDVALVYQPFSFHLLSSESIRANTSRPTRDVLHATGCTRMGDTLDVYVVHLPSKLGGIKADKNRSRVVDALLSNVDSVHRARPSSSFIIMGDFNDELKGEMLVPFSIRGFSEAVEINVEKNGVGGTYKYQGTWSAIDHILYREGGAFSISSSGVLSEEFLLEDDKPDGKKPFRTYIGTRYNGGISDHLPIWVRLQRRKITSDIK